MHVSRCVSVSVCVRVCVCVCARMHVSRCVCVCVCARMHARVYVHLPRTGGTDCFHKAVRYWHCHCNLDMKNNAILQVQAHYTHTGKQ